LVLTAISLDQANQVVHGLAPLAQARQMIVQALAYSHAIEGYF
jgi:hypothetical protein